MDMFNKLSWWQKAIVLGAAAYAGNELYQAMTEKKLEGQVILITGGGSGIGRMMALKMAKMKARLVLWDVNKEACDGVAKQIVSDGGEAKSYVVDVTDIKAVNEAAAQVVSDFERVDILINNAGIVSGRNLLDNSPAAIRKTFEVNTISHFWTVKAFLPAMIKRNSGHIVTISSASGMSGVPGLADYAASKWAVLGFGESLRLELKKLGKTGVKTTTICPYYIRTPLFAGAKTKFSWLLPILEPDYVANRIITAIRRNTAVVALPYFVWATILARALLSPDMTDVVANFFGVTDSMDDFKGRPEARKLLDSEGGFGSGTSGGAGTGAAAGAGVGLSESKQGN